MGCDIHATIEVRHEGKWICIDTLNGHHMRFASEENPHDYSAPITEERNYQRFAALAGVRGEGPDPLGIPDDVSETTKFLIDEWGPDGHSHSYLDLKEACRIWLMTSGIMDPHSWAAKFPMSYFFNFDMGDKYDPASDARIVFWFDN